VLARKTMTTTVAKVNRSDLYHSIAEIRVINEVRIARLDIWGSVIVTFLFVGGINLIRAIFAN
jgi:hypothetical protein